MADTTAISICGIVVSGIVGPSLAAYWGNRRSEADRHAARADGDMQEMRELFSDSLRLMLDARLKLARIEVAARDGKFDPPASETAETDSPSRQKAQEELLEIQTPLR